MSNTLGSENILLRPTEIDFPVIRFLFVVDEGSLDFGDVRVVEGKFMRLILLRSLLFLTCRDLIIGFFPSAVAPGHVPEVLRSSKLSRGF